MTILVAPSIDQSHENQQKWHAQVAAQVPRKTPALYCCKLCFVRKSDNSVMLGSLTNDGRLPLDKKREAATSRHLDLAMCRSTTQSFARLVCKTLTRGSAQDIRARHPRKTRARRSRARHPRKTRARGPRKIPRATRFQILIYIIVM